MKDKALKKGKTIKQIADEIGVSKTAVRNKIANLGLQSSLRKNGNQFAIDNEQESLIKSAFIEIESQTKIANQVCDETETFRLVCDMVCVFKQQLEEKDKQLQEKDKQLEQHQQRIKELTSALDNTTDSLKAAQALHAGTIQQNLLSEKSETSTKVEGVTQKWWHFWK